jgi:hypothetical protein
MAWVDVPGSNSIWQYENSATASNTYADAPGTYSGGIRTYTTPGTGQVNKAYARTRKKGQQNLLNYSEQFDNAFWSKLRATLTADATTAPDDTTTADKLIQAAGQTSNGLIQTPWLGLNVVDTQSYMVSVFAKKGTNRNYLALKETLSTGGGGVTQWFNLNTGALATLAPGSATSVAAISDEGNGWYRCSVKFTANATRTGGIIISVSENDGNTTNTDDQGFIYLWGAMFADGSILTPYKKAEASISTLIERGELSKDFYDATHIGY